MIPCGATGALREFKTKVKNRPQKSGTYVYFIQDIKKKNIEDKI